jgi:hypothetical protein
MLDGRDEEEDASRDANQDGVEGDGLLAFVFAGTGGEDRLKVGARDGEDGRGREGILPGGWACGYAVLCSVW